MIVPLISGANAIIYVAKVIISVAVAILMIVSMCKIMVKAGKPWWVAIVPVYNLLVLLKVVGKPWWWILLYLIPVVNVVIAVIVYYNLSLSFGKGIAFTIGMILLPFVFYPILAFGDASYIGPGGAELQPPGEEKTT